MKLASRENGQKEPRPRLPDKIYSRRGGRFRPSLSAFYVNMQKGVGLFIMSVKRMHFLHRLGAWILALTLAISLAVPASATGIVNVPATNIYFGNFGKDPTAEKKVSIGVGDVYILEAVVEPENASNKRVTWTSADPNIATVSSGGIVKGISPGTTAITASITNNMAVACIVTVERIPVQKIEMNLSELTLSPNGTNRTRQLTARIEPANATNQTIHWQSSDEGVLKVDNTGFVTAQSAGTATITATSDEFESDATTPDLKTTCTITVREIPVTGVEIYYNNANTDQMVEIPLELERSMTLRAQTIPEDATEQAATWKADPVDIVRIYNTGGLSADFQALKEGTTTVTATVGGISKTCQITVTARSVSDITLNHTDATTEVGGAPINLNATVVPDNAKDREVTWTVTGDVGAVSLSTTTGTNTIVTPVRAGEVTVRASTSNGVYRECKIIVTDRMVHTVKLEPETMDNVPVNTTQNLTVTITPTDAANKTITWKTSNKNIAAVVNNAGQDSEEIVQTTTIAGNSDRATVTVRARSAGYAYITAYSNGKALATCPITVAAERVPVTGITLNKTSLEITVGRNERVTATLSPQNPTEKIITWESSDPNVATVAGGSIHAVKAGTATITATANETDKNAAGNRYSATCQVTVKAPASEEDVPVTSLVLDPTKITLRKGRSRTIGVTVRPSGAVKTVTWTSSDEKIATVSDAGEVKGIEVGIATITATTTGLDVNGNPIVRTCEVTVNATGGDDPDEMSDILVTSKTGNQVSPGGTIQLNALVTSDVLTSKEVTWSSSDTSVATVDAEGKVTAVSPGTVQITATSKENAEIKSNPYAIEVSGLVIRNRSGTSQNGRTVYMLAHQTQVFSCNQYGAAKSGTIVWESENMSIAEMQNGALVAHYPGTTTIRAYIANTNFEAKLTVQVDEDTSGVINRTLRTGETLEFSNLISDMNRRCQDKLGGSLSYINSLRVPTDQGTLYYKHETIETPGQGGGAESYYRNPGTGQRGISDITFVPKNGFSGTAVIEFQGYMDNGNNFAGSVRVEVQSAGDIVYHTDLNQPVSFSAQDFSAIANLRLGRPANYVTFSQPAENQGTLYYQYSTAGQYQQKVGADTRYYAGDSKPSINEISFIPAENYRGTVTVPYRCVDSTGAAYNGRVTIYVERASGNSISGADVEYTTGINRRVTLDGSDFNDACRRVNDYSLDSIEFTALPTSREGTLYYNYSSNTNSSRTYVNTGTRYYRSSSPRISYITFVPAEDFNGTVTIPYTGRDTNGNTYTGNLFIHVSDSANLLSYHTNQDQPVSFRAADFNDVCRSLNGARLRYVSFSLPSSTTGTLYHNYRNSSSTGTRVSASSNYYYSGTPNLSDVTFVPKRDYTGTLRISFNGYDINGGRFSGTVQITVGPTESRSSGQIYYTGSSLPIYWETWDFQQTCQSMLAGTLSHIRLNSLPDSSCGRLYVNYTDISKTGSLANTTTDYKASGSPEIGQLVFLPKAGYQGQVSIPYTGYDTRGRSYQGVVNIELNNAFSPSAFSDLYSWEWAQPSIEFLRQNGITTGYGDGTFAPGRKISRGEFALMICRAFRFQTTNDRQPAFPDVQVGSSYAGAVAAAQRLGIVQGNGGLFRPDDAITRQSAITMIARAMTAAGRAIPNAPTSLLSAYNDGAEVSAYARSAVAGLVQMGVVQGNTALQLKPTAAISRAEMAVILHRVLTT